ncbi:MAG TPA: hypothetical protein VN043_17625 [Rhodanobacter sp.]|nr:hypothetical protein [Rhodanobacter sp.]
MKLAARLRNYDWTAAAIELLIVVVGILIALQVSNWNQSRLDHARADNYYRRLHIELLADQHNIDNALAYWNKVSAYGRAAMRHGESGQRVEDSNWKTVLAYYQASQLMPFELEETTYSEMRDGGGLALVDDESLRKQLADYYQLSGTGITAAILHHDPLYRMQIRGLTPWAVQQYIWNQCFRQGAGGNAANQRLIDCPAPISESEAATILDSYRRSDTLLQNLRTWMSTLRVSSLVLDSTRHQTHDLAARVQAARRD